MTIDPRDPEAEPFFRRILKEIEESTRRFAEPSADFDPRTANPEDLERYGIPPPPDRHLDAREYDFWERMFTPPLRFRRSEFAFSFPLPFPYRLNYRVTGVGGRHQGSANWSGGYVTPKRGTRIEKVHATWQVPTPNVPASAPAGVTEFRSSTWVGLDGQRRYLHSSLPQIGTSQIVRQVNGIWETSLEAWWQWWVRGHQFPPVRLVDFLVSPGDLILCSLEVLSPTIVKFYIKNQRTGHFERFEAPAPSATMAAGPTPVQLEVSGATAEWIMERPTRWLSDVLYSLPDYNTVAFNDCFAVATHRSGRKEILDLTGAKLINMYEVRANPHRTADISIAQQMSDDQLATVYR